MAAGGAAGGATAVPRAEFGAVSGGIGPDAPLVIGGFDGGGPTTLSGSWLVANSSTAITAAAAATTTPHPHGNWVLRNIGST